MANMFLFIHGINNNSQRREQLTEEMKNNLKKFDCLKLFEIPHTHDFEYLVKAICWRSLGNFFKDLEDLKVNSTRWDEAVSDVADEIINYISQNTNNLDNKSTVILVGHSMGQPILVSALYYISQQNRLKAYMQGIKMKLRLITIGGPMGNPLARPYFMQMNQLLWAKKELIDVDTWIDIWNKEDPVNGGLSYTKFLAAESMRIDIPGHPTIFTPLAEHSSYFFSKEFYSTIQSCIDDK